MDSTYQPDPLKPCKCPECFCDEEEDTQVYRRGYVQQHTDNCDCTQCVDEEATQTREAYQTVPKSEYDQLKSTADLLAEELRKAHAVLRALRPELLSSARAASIVAASLAGALERLEQ
jgi:hypothetical protein